MGRTMPSYCEHGKVFDWGDFGGDDASTESCPQCEARWDLGTQIVITPPQGAAQILVRVPHPYEPDQIQVDYRDAPGEVWQPAESPCWPNTVQVNVG